MTMMMAYQLLGVQSPCRTLTRAIQLARETGPRGRWWEDVTWQWCGDDANDAAAAAADASRKHE